MGDSPSVAASLRVTVRRVGDDKGHEDTDFVAVEEPLEIRLTFSDGDGKTRSDTRKTKSISITMRTPGDDLNLAAGFLFTEGIIHDAAAIVASENLSPNIINVELAHGISVGIDKLQRNFYTTSSCGVCGKASLEALSVQASHAVFKLNLRKAPNLP